MDRELQVLIWSRAGSICEYCHMPQEFDSLPFELEHIIPLVHEGRTVAGNLALSCFPCNRFKGTNLAGIDPTTNRLTKLFHPRRHTWSHHFVWQDARLLGRTAIGRTTIRVLRINSELRWRLRAELVREGVLELFPKSVS